MVVLRVCFVSGSSQGFWCCHIDEVSQGSAERAPAAQPISAFQHLTLYSCGSDAAVNVVDIHECS